MSATTCGPIPMHCRSCGHTFYPSHRYENECMACTLSPAVIKARGEGSREIDPAGKSACEPASALSVQESGDHYKNLKIQPVEYIHANSIGYFEGCVIKYVTRWKSKNGIADLRKARHFLDLLIELEGSE